MVRTIKAGLALTALAGAFLLQPSLYAQDSMKQDENEARQDARRQSDARRQGKDAGDG